MIGYHSFLIVSFFLSKIFLYLRSILEETPEQLSTIQTENNHDQTIFIDQEKKVDK